MELCTLLKNFPKKTTVFLIYQEMELKKLFHTSENGTFLYFLKRKLSYISENGNPKNLYISGKGTLLYFRKWNFTAQRLTNFRRKLPSSKNYFIFWQMKLYRSKNKKVLIFHSKLSKPTLFALT